MQIQQLRYLIATAEAGSFRAAAHELYVSQSSISVAVRDLERETGVTVFERTSRGVTVTAEGAELVALARSVIEQADILEKRYSREVRASRARLAVSSQHYSLVVQAFGDFIAARQDDVCEFALRESRTDQIIRDVAEMRSDLGIIYRSNYNERVMVRALTEAGLEFESLYVATPHVIVRRSHPLAGRESVTMDDLSSFYRFEQEQGIEASTFFAEEPLAAVPCSRRITISDNGTLETLLGCCDGYAIGTGAFRPEGNVVPIPIATDEVMDVGYIKRTDAAPRELAIQFLGCLARRIEAFSDSVKISVATRVLAGK